MKLVAAVCLVFAASLFGQQPATTAPPALFGQVTGRVICGDTDRPGRFASVQLIAEKPDKAGVIDPGSMGKNPDFEKAVSVVFSTLLKGSDLSGLTGIDGTFTMDKVPPGVYYVVAQLPGYQSPLGRFSQAERMKADEATVKAVESAAEKIVVQANQPAHVELRLERGSSLSGSVRYDDGSPAPGVTPILMAQQKDGKWKDMAIALVPVITNDRGNFRFYGLPPGKYAVKAALPTIQASLGLGAGSLAMHMNMGDALVVYSGGVVREKDVKPVEVAAGDEVDGIEVEFPISGLHSVAGSVVAKSDNHAVNKGAVTLLDSETKTSVRAAMLDRDGNFRLNYVPDGQYILRVSGAADTEKSGAGEVESDFALMMNSKIVKSYGDAEQPLLLKGDATALVLQVPDVAAKTAPAE
jgi:hypothetical protein